MCLSAFASIKEIRVQVMFRLGGIAMCVIPAMSTGVTVLPVLGCASVAPISQVFSWSPRPVIRLASLSFVSQLPVTGRASEGKVTPAMCSRGHAVTKENPGPWCVRARWCVPRPAGVSSGSWRVGTWGSSCNRYVCSHLVREISVGDKTCLGGHEQNSTWRSPKSRQLVGGEPFSSDRM